MSCKNPGKIFHNVTAAVTAGSVDPDGADLTGVLLPLAPALLSSG